MAGMADRDVHRREGLTAGGEGALLDPHPERREAELGIAHEGEQLGDARQGRREGHDLGVAAGSIDGHERGPVPEACGHRAGLSHAG